MSSCPKYACTLCLSLAFLSLGNLGCRVSNPGFGEDSDRDKSTREASSTKSSTANTPSSATPDSSNKGGQTSSTGNSTQTVSASSQSTAAGPETKTPGSTKEETPLHPDELAAQLYCQRGSMVCYPMISVQDGHFKDYGKLKRNMPVTGLSTVKVNQSNYPFHSAVDAAPKGKYKTPESYTVMPTGVIGFDLWIKPIRSDSTNWTTFAIDNYISLIRMSNSKLRCAFEGSDQTKILDRVFTPEEGKFHHVACAFDGEKKIMWVDGVIDRKSSFLPKKWPASTPYIFGWDALFGASPFDGYVGAIRVWEDVEALKAEIKRSFPNAENQASLDPLRLAKKSR